MLLGIKNIGPVGSAQIKLNGLTVIGGLNDTGKSTIGKVLFAIVEAIRNQEHQHRDHQSRKINGLISELVSSLRLLYNSTNVNISPIGFRRATSDLTNVNVFVGEDGAEKLKAALEQAKERMVDELARRAGLRVLRGTLAKKKVPLVPEAEAAIDDTLEGIRQVVSEKVDAKALYSDSLDMMMEEALNYEVNNKRAPNEVGEISLSDENEVILKSTFLHDSLDDLSVNEDIILSLFEDVTLLESPFVLNYDGSTHHPATTSDLFAKLNSALKDVVPSNSLERAISNIVSKTINGRMYYEPENDQFIFSTSDDISTTIANTASGIKTLGIIQMLASAGFLNSTNLLIIDEPEVHLHPAWQIVFAEIIALLVRNNVYCLVSSHSPYFIQAIEAYSQEYGLQESTSFYVTRKDKGNCFFDSVTDNLEPLYKLLADPMKQIAFLRAKAQQNG